MNILFLTDNFPPERNAAASRVYERACYWMKWGHQVTIITSAPNFPEGKIFEGYQNKFYQVEYMDGIRVVRVKTFIAANKGFFLRILDQISFTVPAIFAGIFQKRPDVVIATTPTPFAAIAAWGISLLRRLPFVLEVSDLWPASIVGVGAMRESFAIRLLEKLELFLYHRAKSIIVLSPAFKKNLIARKIDEKKIQVAINGVDLTRYSPKPRNMELAKQYQINPQDFVVGYIGTHGMAHALENVLNTAELLKNIPALRFVFVGAGADRDKLINIASEKSLNNVSFIPAQAKERIADFWSLCSVALVHLKNSPVFAEVIPSKIFEAMGMGLPILIAAPDGEGNQIVAREEVGMTVPAEDPSALAAAIQAYQKNPDLLKTHSEKSYQVAPQYSREWQAKLFLKIVEDTITEG
jgi:colanic acid biosynthesis glycosyl transferase WcaI